MLMGTNTCWPADTAGCAARCGGGAGVGCCDLICICCGFGDAAVMGWALALGVADVTVTAETAAAALPPE